MYNNKALGMYPVHTLASICLHMYAADILQL